MTTTAIGSGGTPTPIQSDEQRMDNLRRANRVRVARGDLKGRIRSGAFTATSALRSADPLIAGMKVEALLLAVPGQGAAKASRALQTCRISLSKTVGGLSDRQREALDEYLNGR